MKIYPNPANDKITIENSYSQPFKIKMYNLEGEVVKNEFLLSDKIQINVRDLSNGVYILVFSSAKKNIQEKIIIRRFNYQTQLNS
ncbi:MAG TPA: T9SS type A sorting domain-containing protein [Bacteroidales bacterium]|nr:T9SS type A sorting domain-containing protein [Bacteroidales bacterium]